MKAYLLNYCYYTWCQGTRDRNVGYALIYAPSDASFANIRSRLVSAYHRQGSYEIILDSVENQTIL
jgi:hypothetical protein